MAFQATVPRESDKRCSGKKGWGEVSEGERSLPERPNVPDGILGPDLSTPGWAPSIAWFARSNGDMVAHSLRVAGNRHTRAFGRVDLTRSERGLGSLPVVLVDRLDCRSLRAAHGFWCLEVKSLGSPVRNLARQNLSRFSPHGYRYERKGAAWRVPTARKGSVSASRVGPFGGERGECPEGEGALGPIEARFDRRAEVGPRWQTTQR